MEAKMDKIDYANISQMAILTERIKEVIIKLFEKKNVQIGLNNNIVLVKAKLKEDAKAVKDGEGKQIHKTIDAQDTYVDVNFQNEPIFSKILEINFNIRELEAELSALDYEFKARKAILNFIANTRKD
jgi:hypothetical protein